MRPLYAPRPLHPPSPQHTHTATDIHKVEAVQRRACDHRLRYTSSITAMMKDLNWSPLEQCLIDRHLVMMYMITYNLVAILASEYLICNTRLSAQNHPPHIDRFSLAQIITSTHFFPSTIIHWNALSVSIVTLPILTQFSSAVSLVIHVSP